MKKISSARCAGDTIETYVFIQKLIFVNYSRHSLARHRVELRSSFLFFFPTSVITSFYSQPALEILQIPFCSRAMCTLIHRVGLVYSHSLFTFLFCFYVCFLLFYGYIVSMYIPFAHLSRMHFN